MGDAYEDFEDQQEMRMQAAELRGMIMPPKVVWTDKAGNKHDPWKMNLRHLGNCIRLCENRGHAKAAKAMSDIKAKREATQ